MGIRGVVLVGLVGSVLLGGCGSAAGGHTPALATTAAYGSTPGNAAPSPADAAVRMVEALDRAETGTFTHRVVTRGETFSITRTMDGSYDLRQGSWTILQRFDAIPPSALGAEATHLNMTFIEVAGKGYMTMPEWPLKLRGRWLPVDPSSLPAGASPSMGDEPIPVVALRGLVGGSVELDADGAMTISGRVDQHAVVGLFGLQTVLAKAKVQPSALKGSAEVTVGVDPQGRPTTMTLEGRDVVFTEGKLPSTILSSLPSLRVDVRFAHYGEAVKLAPPPQASFIDPSEMGS